MGKHNATPYRNGNRRGRHAAPNTNHALRIASVATAGAVMSLALTQPANAEASDQVSELRKLIQCESSGNPTVVNRSNSNRPAGAWQIITSTWRANGGAEFAPTADAATLAEQNIVAIRVSKTQGAQAWACAGAGLRSPFSAADVAAATGVGVVAPVTPKRAQIRAVEAPAQAAPPVVSGPTYIVNPGDTLSGIAIRAGEDWEDLYQRNTGVVGSDPNRIFPGQVLSTKEAA